MLLSIQNLEAGLNKALQSQQHPMFMPAPGHVTLLASRLFSKQPPSLRQHKRTKIPHIYISQKRFRMSVYAR